jgi:nitric oxide reductase subunit C
MIEGLTRNTARNIFFGGSLFFLVVFVGLTVHSHYYIVTQSTDHAGLNASVRHGKEIWERHSCINCHSLLGEGAYFAPELGNVWARYGGFENPDGARAGIKAYIRIQPLRVPGRRQMPNFGLTDEELESLVDFFEWTNRINTQGWPPNHAG